MKILKKHKWISFALISFVALSGVNFYMIFELIKVIRSNLIKNRPILFRRFGHFLLYIEIIHFVWYNIDISIRKGKKYEYSK